jgi:3-dehydroquinate synthetase
VERLSQGRLLHGEAVAVGLMAEAQLSHRLGWLDADAVEAHRHVLGDLLGLRLSLPQGLDADAVLQAVAMDNKKSKHGVRYVLLKGLGQVALEGGRPLVSVPEPLVREVLQAMRHAPQ